MSMGAPEPCTEDRSRDFTKSRFTRGPYTDVPPKGLPVGPAPSVFFVVAATEFEPKGWMIEPRSYDAPRRQRITGKHMHDALAARHVHRNLRRSDVSVSAMRLASRELALCAAVRYHL